MKKAILFFAMLFFAKMAFCQSDKKISDVFPLKDNFYQCEYADLKFKVPVSWGDMTYFDIGKIPVFSFRDYCYWLVLVYWSNHKIETDKELTWHKDKLKHKEITDLFEKIKWSKTHSYEINNLKYYITKGIDKNKRYVKFISTVSPNGHPLYLFKVSRISSNKKELDNEDFTTIEKSIEFVK